MIVIYPSYCYHCRVVFSYHFYLRPFVFLPQVVHHFWVSVPTHVIWHVDSCLLHYVLLIVHIGSWLSVACSVLTIDYLELLGLRQVR